MSPAAMPETVWTVGHSTRPLEEFLELLATFRIDAVADVRRFPGSRRYPWFAGEALRESLPAHGIAYRWIPQLGGRRKVLAGSPNGGWRNPSFQGYADHLASAEFAEGLAQALALATDRRMALMCAEAPWWRCHRALIADVLKLRGIEVIHILDATHAVSHPYTAPAHIVDGRLSYAPRQAPLL